MSNDLTDRVLEAFYRRAPNSLTAVNIAYDLPDIEIERIRSALGELESDGKIHKREGIVSDDYSLDSYRNVPSKTYISLGSVKLPRLLANERARPEDINIFMEALATRFLDIEKAQEERLSKLNREYWGNTIVLFGAFIGIFSLIVVFLGKIEYAADAGFQDILMRNLAQVLPMAIVLAIFVFVLKKVFD